MAAFLWIIGITGFELSTLARRFGLIAANDYCRALDLLSKKSDCHTNVDIEFGEGEELLSLKKAEKRAEGRKLKEKVTYKRIQQDISEWHRLVKSIQVWFLMTMAAAIKQYGFEKNEDNNYFIGGG